MNPFSSTTSSDFGVQTGDIVGATTDLIIALSPIIMIGLGILFVIKLIPLIRYALGNKTVFGNNIKYTMDNFIENSVHDKSSKYHPDRYFADQTREQKYREYLLITDNGKRNDKW